MDAYPRARQGRRRASDKHLKGRRPDVNRIANPATYKPAVRGLLRNSFDTDGNRGDLDVLRTLSLPFTSGRIPYDSGSRQRIISGNERRSCMDAARSRSDANQMFVHPGFYNFRPSSFHFPPKLSGANKPRRITKGLSKKRSRSRGRRRQRSTTSASSSSSSSEISTSTESSVEETIRVKRSPRSPRAKQKSQVEALEERLVEVEKLRKEAEAKAEKARNDLKQIELRELYMKQMDAKGAPRPTDEPRVIFPSSPSRLASRGVRSPRRSEPSLTPPAPQRSEVAVVQQVPTPYAPPEVVVSVTPPPQPELSPSPVRYLSSWESLPQPAWSQQPPPPAPQQRPQPQPHHQQRIVSQYPPTAQGLGQPTQLHSKPPQIVTTIQNATKEMIPVTRIQEPHGPISTQNPPHVPTLSPLAAAYGYLTDPRRPLPPREVLPDSLAPSSRSRDLTSAFASSGRPMLTDAPNRMVDSPSHVSPRTLAGNHRVTLVTDEENDPKVTAREVDESSEIVSSRRVPITSAFHPARPMAPAPSTQGDASRFVDANIPDVSRGVTMEGSVTKSKHKTKSRKASRCGC